MSSGLIGAMSVLAFVVGGSALVHFLRKTNGTGDDDDDDDDDDFDLDSQPSTPDAESRGPTLGVPSINWGGQDHGRKMQVQV